MTQIRKNDRPSFPSVTDVVQVLRDNKAFKAMGATKQIRIKILRNYSAEYIEPFLKYYFGQIGVDCEVDFGGYDTIHQELLAEGALAGCDLVVLSLVLAGLAPDADLQGFAVDELFQRITTLAELAVSRTSAPVIVNSFLRPTLEEGGPAQALREGSPDDCIAELNHRLRRWAMTRMPRCLLVDWERLLMRIGMDAALDPRMAYLARAPFKHSFLSGYAHEIFRIGRALQGGSKKCLILDCDDTLWGGVVGELGLDGIELDRSNYPGRAFYDFQKSVLRLVDQGVMVALCSKNNLEDVMAVLDEHPHCLLKRDHLVGHRINWEGKERNIQELVEELNISMDTVVFVDDNPTECARIEAFLPNLTVRQVPAQLYDLPLLLEREGLFDKLSVSKEDLERTKLYQAEAKRRDGAAAFASVDEFLASLDLRARITPASAAQITRIAQLTQKTNQFNLTTRRYTDGDIAQIINDADQAVFTLSATDRYGDLGLSGVLIAKRRGKEAEIDTLLMSCRVLGRKLENQFVVSCLEHLTVAWAPNSWSAEYIPTKKNRQVAEFWPAFGFRENRRRDTAICYRSDSTALKLDRIPFIEIEAT
jgi:FkbH-like protein